MASYRTTILYRPGRTMSDQALEHLRRELVDLAAACFDDVPMYQVLEGSRECFSRAIVVLARDPTGRLLGFSSSLLLAVEDVGDVMHLGLLCVHPEARASGLSHRLTGWGAAHHLLRRGYRKTWFSNLACTVSSLGNVGQYFDKVYPSPTCEQPTETHRRIGCTLVDRHRKWLYIREDAVFDQSTFVVRGSVRDTPFQKSDTDNVHRDEALTEFYCRRLRFEHGDEILQVGHASLSSVVRYALRGRQRLLRSLVRRRQRTRQP